MKKFRVRDILPRDFVALDTAATLAKVLEIIFHSHQENFPILDGNSLAGFITRQDIMQGMHRYGMDKQVVELMRRSFPTVRGSDTLIGAQRVMHEKGISALPVVKDGNVIGVITVEDIGRVYALASQHM